MTSLAAKQIDAMNELLRRAKKAGHVAHVGLFICQAQNENEVDDALQILGELEAEDPTGTWYKLDERGVLH